MASCSFLAHVVTTFSPGAWINREHAHREYILPTPLPGGVGMLPLQGEGQVHVPVALGEILLVQGLDLGQMLAQGLMEIRSGRQSLSTILTLGISACR